MSQPDKAQKDQHQTHAPAPDLGQRLALDHIQRLAQPQVDPDGVDQSMLRDLVQEQLQLDPAIQLAPKSIEQVITDIVTAAIREHQYRHLNGLPVVAHVAVPYSLNAASVIYLEIRLHAIFGPTVEIETYHHQKDQQHVLFQFKVLS